MTAFQSESTNIYRTMDVMVAIFVKSTFLSFRCTSADPSSFPLRIKVSYVS